MPTPDYRPSIWLDLCRLSAAAALLKAGCIDVPVPPPHVPLLPETSAQAVWMVDATGHRSDVLQHSAPLPTTPLDGQETRKERCMRAASYIYGGCWVALLTPPPCDPGTFVYQGRCHAPQRKTLDAPVSMDGQ